MMTKVYKIFVAIKIIKINLLRKMNIYRPLTIGALIATISFAYSMQENKKEFYNLKDKICTERLLDERGFEKYVILNKKDIEVLKCHSAYDNFHKDKDFGLLSICGGFLFNTLSTLYRIRRKNEN